MTEPRRRDRLSARLRPAHDPDGAQRPEPPVSPSQTKESHTMSYLDKLITAAADQIDGVTDRDDRIKILHDLVDRATTHQQVTDSNTLRDEAKRVETSARGESGMANIYNTAVSSIIRRCADLVGRRS